mmetsp:Transcript_39607/g.99197  ORF Transcript_39607/g.99197 Transcript_39607/m.99197 type:complete len:104 (-) Transcript_39607:910-1221(-)
MALCGGERQSRPVSSLTVKGRCHTANDDTNSDDTHHHKSPETQIQHYGLLPCHSKFSASTTQKEQYMQRERRNEPQKALTCAANSTLYTHLICRPPQLWVTRM